MGRSPPTPFSNRWLFLYHRFFVTALQFIFLPDLSLPREDKEAGSRAAPPAETALVATGPRAGSVPLSLFEKTRTVPNFSRTERDGAERPRRLRWGSRSAAGSLPRSSRELTGHSLPTGAGGDKQFSRSAASEQQRALSGRGVGRLTSLALAEAEQTPRSDRRSLARARGGRHCARRAPPHRARPRPLPERRSAPESAGKGRPPSRHTQPSPRPPGRQPRR